MQTSDFDCGNQANRLATAVAKPFCMNNNNEGTDDSDYFQEAMIKIWESQNKYKPELFEKPISEFNYLFGVARNRLIDISRNEQRYNKRFNAPGDINSFADKFDFFEDHAQSEFLEHLFSLISINPQVLEVIRLHYYEGLTYKEISEKLGVSNGNSLKLKVFHVFNKIRNAIQKEETAAAG